MTQSPSGYLLAGQASELERLQLQARVWEPVGRSLLQRIPAAGSSGRALDVGCGAMGWLRILSEWAGEKGAVVGTDVDDRMLAAASDLIKAEKLANVSVAKDDLFASKLQARSFDLVHARFQICPLGRDSEQVSAFLKLVKPGGWLVLEDPDSGSWHASPRSPDIELLISLIKKAFLLNGGDFDAGRNLPSLMRDVGLQPKVSASLIALEPAHPYLRLPIQFANALRPRLESLISPADLDKLLLRVEDQLKRPDVWGTTFTLIQTYARCP
jgi:SAM-dependent methyltransferase